MGYLEDSTVVRLLSGRFDDSARSRVEPELARCRRCAAFVAEIMHGCSAVHLEPRRDPPDLEATGELVDRRLDKR